MAHVTIDKFAFTPASITVQAGQSVTFTNNDAVAHTATSASEAAMKTSCSRDQRRHAVR